NDVTDWSVTPEPRWAVTATCTIRDTVFSLAIEPAGLNVILRILLRHLETPNARPDYRLEISEASGNERALLIDGRERLRTPSEGQLLGAMNQAILERIHSGTEWLAMIHGGAVARNGLALAIAAPGGSGKTTLIAYLLAQEGFT